jgi:hypothetical protein
VFLVHKDQLELKDHKVLVHKGQLVFKEQLALKVLQA